MSGTGVSIDLSEEAHSHLKLIYGSFGMTQRATLLRLMLWFERQDRNIQALILGHLKDEITDDFIEFLYRRRHGLQDAGDQLHAAPTNAVARAGKKSKPKRASAG